MVALFLLLILVALAGICFFLARISYLLGAAVAILWTKEAEKAGVLHEHRDALLKFMKPFMETRTV